MMKRIAVSTVAALLAASAWAGEYHVGGNLLCYDCHTMHFSMQHGWAGTTPVGTTPVTGGDWLSATGPNQYLLKAPVNQICLECHDARAFAPDVLETNINVSPTWGRTAGALNEHNTTPYESWKGHTLDSTVEPPGWDSGIAVGFAAGSPPYTPANGLECINCHTQHGRDVAYRNLGPRRIGAVDFAVTYSIAGVPRGSGALLPVAGGEDVMLTEALVGVPGQRTAADFAPFYSAANRRFNRVNGTRGTVAYANKVTVLCAMCHGNFHADGGTGTPAQQFTRHPNAGVNIGGVGGGHSSLPQYAGTATVPNANKVPVATADYTAFTNSSPICMSCHKAHGNQNPFGLLFQARTAGLTVTEEGTTTDYVAGHRALCGQCHRQGGP